MVKIISKGNLPSEKVFRATCQRCCTHFEFRAGEASFHSDQREGDSYSIACPLEGCGNRCYVDAKATVIYAD